MMPKTRRLLPGATAEIGSQRISTLLALVVLMAMGVAPHADALGGQPEKGGGAIASRGPGARSDDLLLTENPFAGGRIFFDKHCIKCHSIQNIGGDTGPDLGDISLGGFSDITSELWNHFPRMNEAFRNEDLVWPELDSTETKELITFLYYLNFFDQASNPEMGKRLFHEKNCNRCHSVGGKGGDIGPKLDKFQNNYALASITAALWNSGPKMIATMVEEKVPRPLFQKRDVVDILAFIRNDGLSDRTEKLYLPPANPVAGKELFNRKGCVRCHAIRGKGGKIGPDLAARNLKGSLTAILSEMWNHGANMWPLMKTKGIKFPNFTPRQMSDLISYIYFLDFDDLQGNDRRGKEVFSEKKCKTCHIPGKPGEETIGPDLAQAGLESPFDIVSAMWNHAPSIEERMAEENIRWPLLEWDEMRDMIAYILVINGGQ
jgi:mono/diheme cytochrome c family protein